MISNGNSAEASTSPSPAPSSIGNNAPKFGTLVPNRVFVGGISVNTTEQDLLELFSKYGKVKATKVISDRAGVSKGYGFVTFETEEEAKKLTQESEIVMLKDRKLNIAPAIKKQSSELNYIKQPFSPRLVDSAGGAAVMGSNGTVFFSNGQTYAYTGAVPMLTSPTEYPQSVPGMPPQPAHHPSFPAQVPQSVTPTVANGPTQTTGTPQTPAAYPPFVYPQIYYPQAAYQQYQAASIQPQWTAPTGQPWRWVNPGSLAQPESSPQDQSTSEASSVKEGSPPYTHFPFFSPPYTHSHEASAPPPNYPTYQTLPTSPQHDYYYANNVEATLEVKPLQKTSDHITKEEKEGAQLVVNYEEICHTTTSRGKSYCGGRKKKKSTSKTPPKEADLPSDDSQKGSGALPSFLRSENSPSESPDLFANIVESTNVYKKHVVGPNLPFEQPWGLPQSGWPSWCPHHNHPTPMMTPTSPYLPVWPQQPMTIFNNSPSKSDETPSCKGSQGHSPPLGNFSPQENSQKERSGRPLDPTEYPGAPLPNSPMMVVPWCQLAPNPWYQWPYQPMLLPYPGGPQSLGSPPVSYPPKYPDSMQASKRLPGASAPPYRNAPTRPSYKKQTTKPCNWKCQEDPPPISVALSSPKSNLEPLLAGSPGTQSLSLLGPPLQCFRRVARLPDDRCALLPLSPPLTPLPLDASDSQSILYNHSSPIH